MGHHKLELSQMKRAKKLDCFLSEKPSGTRAITTFRNPSIVEIDEEMKVNVVLMGQSIPLTMLQYSSSLTTKEEVRAFLKHVDEVTMFVQTQHV